MKLAAIALAAAVALSGCASAPAVSRWEGAAVLSMAGDIASSQGGGAREVNPLYGDGELLTMATVNAAVYLAVKAALRDAPESVQRATWGWTAAARAAAILWNLWQREGR